MPRGSLASEPHGRWQILSEKLEMCGRYTLSTPADLISENFDVADVPALEARFNIAPSQEALIIGSRSEGSRRAGLASWGLFPRFRRESAASRRFINARIETVAQRPSFQEAFARRRCLVPADGFFEWRATAQGKVPVFFSLREGGVFAFAGIWDPPVPEIGAGAGAPSFALLTTRPNELVGTVHDRMPVILHRRAYDRWLARQSLPESAREHFARPFPSADLQCWEVSRLVNSPANDSRRCIEPVVSG